MCSHFFKGSFHFKLLIMTRSISIVTIRLLMHIRLQPTKHLETFGKDSGAQKEAAALKH